MEDTESKCTRLTAETLKESTEILQSVIDICNTYSEGSVSWNQECRKRNLDPLKARRVILNLYKCISPGQTLEEMTYDVYDNYELFYGVIFGERAHQAKLPSDYKESVLYVVKSSGLKEQESYILMCYFGLDGQRKTFVEIGQDLGISKSRVEQIYGKVRHKCRMYPRLNILKMGLTQYRQMVIQKKKSDRQLMENKQLEHEALMAKRDEEHREHMAIIESCSYDDAVVKILPADISDILTETDIAVLNLTVRSHNALRYNAGIENLFELLQKNIPDLMAISNMGIGSAQETVNKLDDYVQNNYHMTAIKLRSILMPVTT